MHANRRVVAYTFYLSLYNKLQNEAISVGSGVVIGVHLWGIFL